jgi:hypothetical protein
MPDVILKSGDVLTGELVSIGEPRLAVIHGDRMVELEASQIQRIDGGERGLVLPRDLPRASHYRRALLDVHPANGRVSLRETVILIGADEDRLAANRDWDAFLGKEGGDDEAEYTWEIEFCVGSHLQVQAFDEFGHELRVRHTGQRDLPRDGQAWTTQLYAVELEVPAVEEWPTHVQVILAMTGDGWAQEIEPGVWRFRYDQFVEVRPEFHEMFLRLPNGADPVEAKPDARWFRDPRDRYMCRWKRCVMPGGQFGCDVTYRIA